MEDKIKELEQDDGSGLGWTEDFMEFEAHQELSRYLDVRTIDVVKVAEKHILDIRLNHKKEYQHLCGYFQENEGHIGLKSTCFLMQ